MRKPSHLCFLTGLAGLFLAAGAHAQSSGDDDSIEADRPSFAESSKTVDKGRVQLEIGAQWERKRDDESHQRTLYSPTLLRIGLGESAELRIETDGRKRIHEVDMDSGERTTTAGYADTSIGFKWHLADQQGAMPSLALLGDLELPTGSRALRGRGARPAVYLPAEWELGQGWSVEFMPGIGIDSDEDHGNTRYGYGFLAASLNRQLGERLQGFVELAAPQIARAAHGGTQLAVDAGVAWLLTKNCQLDAFVIGGLNRRTPDLGIGFGLSIRR
jgi:hypothetical protein